MYELYVDGSGGRFASVFLYDPQEDFRNKERIGRTVNPIYGELMGLRYGLIYLKNKGIREAKIYTDNTLVAYILDKNNVRRKVERKYKKLISEIFNRLEDFEIMCEMCSCEDNLADAHKK